MRRRRLAQYLGLTLAGLCLAGAPPRGFAKDERAAESAAETEELRRRLLRVTKEVDELKSRLGLAAPPANQLTFYGVAPGAAKIYARPAGFVVGGYGELFVQRQVADRAPGTDFNTSDLARYVQYLGYRFSDRWVFNAGIQIEHAGTEPDWKGNAGSVNVEFAYVDFLATKAFNVRAGVLLAPLGILNQVHEPLSFHGVMRPLVETVIIPSTWREMGVAIFGEPFPGVTYQFSVLGGLIATKFGEGGWREGRQNGNNPLGESVAFAGRVDYRFRDLLEVGPSMFVGGAGQSQPLAPADPEPRTYLGEGHFQLKVAGLEVRALLTYAVLSRARELSLALSSTALLGEKMYGWYGEIAYDFGRFLPFKRKVYLAPYFRFERYDTQHGVPDVAGRAVSGTFDVTVIEAGLSFKPHPQIIVKATYRDVSSAGAKHPDSWFLGGGFVY